MPDGVTDTQVPSSFAQPPRIASTFRERYNNSQQAAQQPVESRHVQQGAAHPAQPNNPLDQPFVEPSSQPVQIGPDNTQQPAPQPSQYGTQQPVYPQYDLDPRVVRSLAAERDALRQQLAQYQDMERAFARQEADARLADQLSNAPELSELESVDPEDARRIAHAASRAMQSRVDELQSELEAQRAANRQSWASLQQHERARAEERAARQVLEAHPDFFDLYKSSPAFLEFLRGHDGYSSKTRDQQAMEEFYNGNTAYVIDLVNRFKGQQHMQPTSVAPVQVAGAATQRSTQRAPAVNYTLSDLNNLMQTRQITQDEYRERLKALRAANSY